MQPSIATSPYTTDPRGHFFPPRGAPESEILAFRDRVINRWSVFRNMHMGRIGLAMWYFLGRQWAELDYEAAFDGVRGAILREADDDTSPSIVRPVTNKIDPAVEQEVIALVKRRWTPKVWPQSNDPRIKAAAQVANDQLNYRLENPDISWREKRHQLGLHFAIGGTSFIYTGWDKSYMDLRYIGAPTAVWCPNCQTKLYSDTVPIDTLRAGIPGTGQPVSMLETAREVMPDESQSDVQEAQLSYCPMCPSPSPLQPIPPSGAGSITDTEMRQGNDVFGRPLGVLEPRGRSTLEIDLPFESYPQDGGAHVTPDTLRRYGRRKIRSLDWLEERYPHLAGDVEPDTISDLLYGDPLLGSWQMLGPWSPSLDSGILDNNVNVDEIVELPTFRNPLGRYVVCTKDKVLEDSDLMEKAVVPSGPEPGAGTETVYVPRVQLSAARYKIRPNEFWGTTIADHVISPQNRLNGIDSQLIEARLRLGSPNVWLPDDMWPFEGPVMDSAAGLGNIYRYRPSAVSPGAKPEVIGGTLMPTDVYMERDRCKDDITYAVGPQDTSQGMAPKNVGTTSGLQFLTEQDEKSRALREDDLVNSAEKSWSHLLQLEWTLRVDEDVYRVLGPNNTWKYQQYVGSTLRGQTEVKIERGSFIARSVIQREAAREALADKVVVVDSPVARRRLAELYGIDTDINEDTNNQVDHAERVWVDFVDKKLVRVQDMIDDPGIHYQVLGTHLRTEEGEKLADEAGWEDIERKIAGWEDELRNLIAQEAKSIAFYGGRLTQKQASDAFTQATIAYQGKQDLFNRQRQISADPRVAMMPGPGGQPTPPPVPPDPPVEPFPSWIIPTLLQDRIFMVWQGMVRKKDEEQAMAQAPGAPGVPAPPAPPPPVDAGLTPDPSVYMKMRALVSSYKMSGDMAMAGMVGGAGGAAAGAGAGAAPGAAPGGGATMAPVDKGGPVAPPATGALPGGGPH